MLLDFVIVVVGVYIGIQAVNWNDERQAQKERATSLDRLHSESQMSVAYLRAVVEQYHKTVEVRASVLRNIADGNTGAVGQEQIVLAINYIPLFPAVEPPRSVYDEVISAGQFRNLGDSSVRDAITKYYSSLRSLISFMNYARNMSDHSLIAYHPAVRKEFDPEDFTTQTHTVVDIELALNDPDFVKALQIGHSMQVLSMRLWEDTLVVAEQMCEEIGVYLGRRCDSTGSKGTPAD